MGPIIDCDQHLFESSGLWASHADPRDRDLAIDLVEDPLGYTWVSWQGSKIFPAFRQIPGETAAIGEQMRGLRAGKRASCSYEEMTPAPFVDPDARVRWLDAHGIDEAMLFPNYGLGIERALAGDLHATRVNLGAWNRWAMSVRAGWRRLHPVAHLTLRDPDWLDAQLLELDAADVRTAMIAPSLVDGRPLSHPDLDRCWRAFAEHHVSPVFHVGDFERPFDDAWYADDPDPINPVLSSIFLGTAPALALADLAVHGVFERHPDLRVGVIELSAVWLPLFLLTLDGGFEFHGRFNGEPLTQLAHRPSAFISRQVRVAAFSYEQPARLIDQAGELFMLCSDYPHSEGTATPLEDYAPSGSPDTSPLLFGGNAAWLLHR